MVTSCRYSIQQKCFNFAHKIMAFMAGRSIFKLYDIQGEMFKTCTYFRLLSHKICLHIGRDLFKAIYKLKKH